MPNVIFYKYQGAGNDFILIDNRSNKTTLNKDQIAFLCDRKFGIGADGLMLLNELKDYDFQMVYYNSDGAESTMCGNGGRCIVKFANHLGIIENRCKFLAIDGGHEAEILTDGTVKLGMTNIQKITDFDTHWFLDTGSPHAVLKVRNVNEIDLVNEARVLRYSDQYKKEGTNVNFIHIDNNEIFIRTYERGVEDETLACGTGVTAAAITAHNQGWIVDENIKVHAKGGDLSVSFTAENDNYTNVNLIGPAKFVFEGEINV